MLKFGNKEFRNLQEQVLENMNDIANLKLGDAVLSEFGIKVVGEVASADDLPTVLEYKSDNPDWEYGDAYAVGTEPPYTLYILTRANDMYEDDYWFDIGVFPAPGPQGEQGPRGETGPQGQTGATGDPGASAGFGTITATAETLSPGSSATATVTASGPDTAKEFSFTFGIPQGESAAFVHYVTIFASTIVGGQYTGTLTLTQYNTLYNNYDSVVVLDSTSSLANNKYFLKRWYVSDDYLVYIGVWSLNNNDTRYYLLKIDRSNRQWTLDVGQPIKITSSNINSTTATSGQVLTADGSGGASWTSIVPPAVETITLSSYVGTLSTDDYNKAAGESCVIIYQDSSGTNLELRKYDETNNTIQYASIHGDFLSPDTSTRLYKLTITKASKYYELTGNHLPITNSNIKTGSLVADKYLKSNGSGGSTWSDLPAQTQADWNQTSASSPAYIKNKPTIPTVPVTDVTVNGTSVLDGTTAKVVVPTDTSDLNNDSGFITSSDIPVTDVTVDGTSVVSSGVAAITMPTFTQVQADWDETDNTKADYIKNKPTIPSGTVTSVGLSAASGSNLTVSGSPVTSSGSMTVGVLGGYSIPSTTDQTTWNGDMKYKGTVGSSADITWSNLISSSTTVTKGDMYYVKTARILTPSASTGNLIIATRDGVGNDSGIWTVLGTRDTNGTVTGASVGGTSITPFAGSIAIAAGSAYDASTNPVATMADLPTVDQTYSSSSTNAQSGVAVANAISGKVNSVVPTTETWTFTLSDDTVVTKTVVTGITVS